MSLLKRIFGPSEPDPKLKLMPLYQQIVATARELHWYEEGQVPDSIDGRFDMVATVLTFVLLRLEVSSKHAQGMAHLTEIFVDDMDGQLRQLGIGDIIVGKHIGRMMGALGGRLGAFRDSVADSELLDEAILRNVYRGETAELAALAHVRETLLALQQRLAEQPLETIVEGIATW